ncbi:phosphotriesterase-related protein [Flavobacteriaceae bacterium MAR_2009_75]|nr:phosphotriesterase-related protein [Flavobacteriaceae bacterium MAR_2009_75]
MNNSNLFWVFILLFLPWATCFSQQETMETVRGPIEVSELGFSLPHEHVMSNFGKPQDSTSVYDEEVLFKQVLPYLKQLKSLGVDAIFDCTTAYFGRRIDLLKKISEQTDINIITNTGFYGGANDKYIPQLAYRKQASDIADIWIDEFENGIEGTSIRPGFIKLAFDSGNPSEIDLKLFEAGVLTHLKTGLTLAVHTGENIEAAKSEMRLLEHNDVHPSAWIWVHANKVTEDKPLLDAAKKGVWISLDGVNETNYKNYAQRIQNFKKKQLLDQLLLSHDGNGFPAGGTIRSFDAIVKFLIPELIALGFTPKEIDLLTKENPQKAFLPSIKLIRDKN